MRLSKFFVAAIAASAIAGISAATAADLPARTYTKAPPPAPVYNWTGCYVGAYLGGATPSRSVNATDPISTGGTFPAGTYYNAPNANATNGGLFSYDMNSSVIGGGTVGCNWQGASPWVVGIEGEGGYMRLTGSRVDPYSVGPTPFASDTLDSTRIGDWYGVIAGRVGYAWDRVLVYGKGGVGFANVNSSTVDVCSTAPCGAALLNANGGSNQAFWVAGGGVEYAFNHSWSIKGEYLFLGIDKTYAVCGPGAATATGSTFCSNHNIDGVHTFKVGVNYYFNGH